jgi:predicted oxidoreductase (fatty acid repression mutant protein)
MQSLGDFGVSRFAGFSAGYGTIIFFDDELVIKEAGEAMPALTEVSILPSPHLAS